MNSDSKEPPEKEERFDQGRFEAFATGLVTAGYIWLVFNGLFSFVVELLDEYLPAFLAASYGIAILGGIGGYLAYSAIYGKSWLREFQSASEVHVRWKARIFGVAWYVYIVTIVILLIWSIVSPIPWWLTLFVIIPVLGVAAPLLGIKVFGRLAKLLGLRFF